MTKVIYLRERDNWEHDAEIPVSCLVETVCESRVRTERGSRSEIEIETLKEILQIIINRSDKEVIDDIVDFFPFLVKYDKEQK